jgi:ABC-2 type transport system ATP-binding protein
VAAVAVDRLRVVRGAKAVLPDMSFAVESGTVTGLLGPSGSGKSTVMRAIVGVQLIAGGRVEVLGADAGSAPLRRRVGYVTQAPSVYTDLTVRENLAYFAKVLDAPPERIDRALEIVGLRALERRIVRTLSGGELSRASLAPPPCSASPSCSCSTSRRSASTPCSAATCGRPSVSSLPAARRCSSRRT